MKKVLIVDDEENIRLTCKKILEKKGFCVDAAGSIKEGKEKLLTDDFDLVITDMRFPGESGLELIRFVKEKFPEVGVIVMTGYADIEDAVRCMKEGAYDYMLKPFDMEEFLRRVDKFFEEKGLKKAISRLTDTVSLYKIALAIARIKPLDEVLDVILDTAIEIVNADGGSIALYDEEKDLLIVKVARGKNSDIAIGKILKVGERVCGYAALKREPVIVHGDLSNDPRFKDFKAYDGIKSGLSIPMIIQNELIGVLNLKRTEKEEIFTEDDLQRAFVIAEIGSLAVSNARVFEKMKELDELKSHFLSTVSHELRTPLTAIKGAADLSEKVKDEETCIKLRDIIKRNTMRMMRLVNDLLDFSRIERGRFPILKREVSVYKIIKNSIETTKQKAEKKNIKIDLNIEKDLPEVFWDPERIEQVLMNLIDNAIKFSQENTKIEIRARRDKEHILIDVIDEGKGIPRKEQKKIFEKFYQIDRSLTREVGGFGLGLSIVKKIVELHNGEIFVESPPEGRNRGTKFTVKLPIKEE
ncbi:MAG: hypothetical protein DRI36_02440 [Caldiserica bacterium]|nr:MAG: hypothetical protein DRI36_02440 [Caldisericota bacterium]